MRRIMFIVALALIAVAAFGSPPAQAATAKFKNCAQVAKKYPAGVAMNAASADASMKATGQRPAVGRAIYLANARLDGQGSGVICPAKTTAPVAVPVLPSDSYVRTGVAMLDALTMVKLDSGEFTADQGLFVGLWVGALERTNALVKICPLWGSSVFSTGFLNSAVTQPVLDKVRLPADKLQWAKDEASLATTLYCSQNGFRF
jgi:hypothetical protein